MAGAADLKTGSKTRAPRGRSAPRLALLALAVALVHVLVLELMWHTITDVSDLRSMTTPMFTRVITPEAPPVVVAKAAPAPAPKVAPRKPSITSLPQAAPPMAAASEPEVPLATPEPAPEPVPEPVASPQEPVASAPETTASPQEAVVTPEAAQTQASSIPPVFGVDATAAPAYLNDWPADTRLTYELSGVFRGPLHGSAQVQWQREGALYQVRVAIDPNLLPGWVMTSQGEVLAEGLSPQVYEEVQTNRRRTVRLGESAVILNDGRSVPRPANVQDTASQFIELSHRFATGQVALKASGQISIYLARPGAVDLWTYDISGPEFLDTKVGRLETWRLKPRPIANPRGNITPEIWFAPGLRFLPVRIRVNQGDENFVDLLVEQVEQR
ncbi:MAG: DUF3108 domain-containing protein [Ramlibacter sp.]|nr:DUF3108 domain-containing protein [Ramlibacter sp.]